MSEVFVADNIHTYYGKSHILHGVSMSVREGELVALLGAQRCGQDHHHALDHGPHPRRAMAKSRSSARPRRNGRPIA